MKRFIAIILFCIAALSAFAEPRNALLIANGQYQKFSKLANPVNEAKELAKSLQELGFEVNLVENASFETMNIEIKKFRDKLKADKGIGFFHYGGHAVQVQGENYLIPVNADIPNEDYIPSRTVNVSEVMNSMLADTNIIILDSCRDNPFIGSGRSASRGLQSVKFKPKNSVIVYSAEAGKTATDGVFTPILTQKIKENQDLLYVLRDVRNEVYNRTGGEQTPGEYNQLMTAVNLCVGIPSRLAAVEAENERINKELELLRAKQNSANSKEKQEAEIELRRVEAESKRKQLELQQVREAEARRAAETKRIEEENAKKNENQKKQEEQFAKMQADNAAKLREIERLKNDQAGLEEMVATANEIKKTIAKITSDFNTAMEKAIADTKAFYQKKRDEIKIGKWESDDEFAVRKKNETTQINKLEAADTAKIKSDYQKEIDGNTASLKRQLQSILDKPVIITGSRIKTEYGEYDRNEQRFPVTITETQNVESTYNLYIAVHAHDTGERNRICQDIDNNIQSGGYVGYLEYGIVKDEQSEKYIADVRNVGLKKLSDGVTVVSFNIAELKRMEKIKQQKELVDKMKKYPIGAKGPGGGIVCYVSENGFDVYETDGSSKKYHFLEVSDVISRSITWCPFDYDKYKNHRKYDNYCCSASELSTKNEIGYGKYNTFRIINGKHRHGTVNESNCAAMLCYKYATPTTKAGDWWLPSKDELNLIYTNLKCRGYIFDNSCIWSSSSFSNDNAWYQLFSNGNQYNYYKYYQIYVRAVRAF